MRTLYILDKPTQLRIEELWRMGHGAATIALKIRAPAGPVKRHLDAKGMIRTRAAALEAKVRLGGFR